MFVPAHRRRAFCFVIKASCGMARASVFCLCSGGGGRRGVATASRSTNKFPSSSSPFFFTRYCRNKVSVCYGKIYTRLISDV